MFLVFSFLPFLIFHLFFALFTFHTIFVFLSTIFFSSFHSNLILRNFYILYLSTSVFYLLKQSLMGETNLNCYHFLYQDKNASIQLYNKVLLDNQYSQHYILSLIFFPHLSFLLIFSPHVLFILNYQSLQIHTLLFYYFFQLLISHLILPIIHKRSIFTLSQLLFDIY